MSTHVGFLLAVGKLSTFLHRQKTWLVGDFRLLVLLALVQGVTQPSSYDDWDRLQQTPRNP